MRFLRQNTAVKVTVGPFIDHADGLTPLDAMTEANLIGVIAYDADDGDAVTAIHFHPAHHDAATDNDMLWLGYAGMWELELTAANVNYTGRMMLCLTDAAQICPVFHEFQVLAANVYDSLFTGHGVTADVLQVDVAQWLGTACATPTVNGVPEVDLTHVAGSTTNVSTLATSVAAIETDTATIDTAAEIAAAVWGCDATTQQTQGTFGQAIGDPAADANTIYKAVVTDATGATVGADVVAVKAETVEILTDTAVIGALGAGLTALATAAELAKVPKSDGVVTWNATALASIQTEANDALIANNLDHLALTPTVAADMTTEVVDNTILSRILGNGDTSTFVPSTDGLHAAGVDLDAILADTNELQVDDTPTALTAIKGDTAAILLDTGTDGVIVDHVDTGAIDDASFAAGAIDAAAVDAAALGDAEFGGKLAAHIKAVLMVIVGVGSDTTNIVLNAATGVDGTAPSATDDFYNGRVLVFTSGAMAGQATAITDYDAGTVTLVVVAVTHNAVAGVTAVIV